MKRYLLIPGLWLGLLMAAIASDYTGPTAPANEDTAEFSLRKINKLLVEQLTGAPSTFTIATSNATVFSLARGEVGFIQNLDDAALAVKYGDGASTTSLSFILAAGTAADDGKGGAVRIDNWIGAVSVAAMSGSPRFIAWKQAP